MSAMMDMMGTGQDISAALFLVIPAGKKAGDTWQDSTSKEGVKIKRTFTLNSNSLTFTAVPEPGVVALMIVGLGGIMLFRRRNRLA